MEEERKSRSVKLSSERGGNFSYFIREVFEGRKELVEFRISFRTFWEKI